MLLSCHAYSRWHAGLDASRYRVSTGDSEERLFSTLDSLMSDAERYKDAEPFIVRCRSCQGQVAFEPISDREVRACPTIRSISSQLITRACAELAALLGGPHVSRVQDDPAHREPADAA